MEESFEERDQGADLLDPRRMLVFGQVARSGSMAAAAQALGWTQPAVAQHIRRLERDVGSALVVRTSRGVTLTEAGRTLAGHADAIKARLQAARADLTALAELRTGVVRIAAFPSAAATFVPAALARLRQQAPGIQVRLTESEPDQATSMLAAADADLIITFSYDNIPEPMPANHQHRILFDDPMMMVLPAGHPLATAPAVSLGQVAHETWIAGCPKCRRHLTTSAANQGFHPDIHHSTDDYVVTQTLVAAGMGVALLPALAIAAATDLRIRTVPLQQHPPRRIRLANRADIPASPATRVLITTLDEIAANRP